MTTPAKEIERYTCDFNGCVFVARKGAWVRHEDHVNFLAAARAEWEAEVQRNAEAAAQRMAACYLIDDVDMANVETIIAKSFGKEEK